MADIFPTRRGFITGCIGFISSIMLSNPRRVKAAIPEIRHILNQVELENLLSSTPQRQPFVSCVMIGDKASLFQEMRGKRLRIGSMNLTGKRIWDACNGRNSAEDISRQVQDRYLVSQHQAKADTLFFLTGLKRIGAIL